MRKQSDIPLAWRPDSGVVELVRVLVLLQGGFAVLSTFELVLVGLAMGTLPVLLPTAAVNGAVAVVVLALVAGLGRRSYRARRLVVAGELFVLLSGMVDLALAVFLAHGGLGLVPSLTRLVLPFTVIALLWRTRRRIPANLVGVRP